MVSITDETTTGPDLPGTEGAPRTRTTRALFEKSQAQTPDNPDWNPASTTYQRHDSVFHL